MVLAPRPGESRPTFCTDGCVAIHVPDLKRAEAFYAGVLGFRILRRTPDQIEFDTGALRLFVNRDAGSVMSFIPALRVSDCDAARRVLRESGCEILHEFPSGRALYFRDPFGLVLDIVECSPELAGQGT